MPRFSTVQCAEWLATSPQLPADALHAAMRSVADTIAAMRLGASHPAARHVAAGVQGYGMGPCATVCAGKRLPAPFAALLNGTAAHALELDDNFLVGGTHGSAVVVPTLLAWGEDRQARGLALLDAFAASLQVQWRLSQFMNPEHGAAGWHPTSTIGAIGAAAACARMARFDTAKTSAALSLAASMAGGTSAQFGFEAKPLHAGLAAKAGVLAAQLAHAGVSASSQAIEDDTGLIALTGAPIERDLQIDDFGFPVALTEFGVNMKPWPTCGSTHPVIHATLVALGSRMVDEIESIDVSIPQVLADNLRYPSPVTADQAKFSLPFAVATAVIDRTVTLASLEDGPRRRPQFAALMTRVTQQVIPNDFTSLKVTVTVRDSAGGSTSASSGFDDLPGSIANPLSDEMLVDRLRIAEDPDGHAERLWDAIKGLEQDGPIAAVAALIER